MARDFYFRVQKKNPCDLKNVERKKETKRDKFSSFTLSSKIITMRQHICERIRADRYRMRKYAVLHVIFYAYTLVRGNCELEGLVGRFVGRWFR